MKKDLTPRERRHQRTRDLILDAARQILREEGIAALSMREIAKRIEYSPAGLYDYFGSKEEIIGEVCEEGFRRLTMTLRSTPTDVTGADLIVLNGVAYVEFALRNPDSYLLMFTNAPLAGVERHPPGLTLQQILTQSPAFMELHQRVQQSVDTGYIRQRADRTVFDMSMMLWQTVHGIAMLGITMGRDFEEYRMHISATLRTLFTGLTLE